MNTKKFVEGKFEWFIIQTESVPIGGMEAAKLENKESHFVEEKDRDDEDSIPLADDDPSAIIDEEDDISNGQIEAERKAAR